MKPKEICLKPKCTYRKQVDKNKAFCMLPGCPYNKSVCIYKTKPPSRNNTALDIIKVNKNRFGTIGR